MIIEFLSESYKKTLEFIAWVVVIAFAILGSISVYKTAVVFELVETTGYEYGERITAVLIGGVTGVLIGLLFNALTLVPLLFLTEIKDSLKEK